MLRNFRKLLTSDKNNDILNTEFTSKIKNQK